MEKKDLRIVYMGTPDFAVESLKVLVEGGYNVVGVITMPDKPAGRGHKIQYSPVKQYALEAGLPLLQPEKLKDETFLSDLKGWRADLQIVVAFRMLPEIVWNMPRLGTFNLHASLLPQYRGAAPINWAVINGDTEIGVTTFFLTHEIDTGRIIKQAKVAVEESDNAGIVHDKLMDLGARLVVETVDTILDGSIVSVEQSNFYSDESVLKAAPKIFKETCLLDWELLPKQVYDFVRGLSPYPAAWTELLYPDGKIVSTKVFEVAYRNEHHELALGTIVTDGKNYVDVAVNDGFVSLIQIQQAGKKRMGVKDFLRGFPLSNEYCFLNKVDHRRC